MPKYTTIADEWQEFTAQTLIQTDGVYYAEDLRKSFYMGYAAAMSNVLKLHDETDEKTCLQVMDELLAEFERFAAHVKGRSDAH